MVVVVVNKVHILFISYTQFDIEDQRNRKPKIFGFLVAFFYYRFDPITIHSVMILECMSMCVLVFAVDNVDHWPLFVYMAYMRSITIYLFANVAYIQF